MVQYIPYLYSLAAKLMLDAVHTAETNSLITSSSSSSSIQAIQTTAPSSQPSSIYTTSTQPSASASIVPISGPIPRNFNLVLSTGEHLIATSDFRFTTSSSASSSGNGNGILCPPDGSTPSCNDYSNTTTLTIANGYAVMYTASGTQQDVYLDPPGDKNSGDGGVGGALRFASINGGMPANALRTGLVIRPESANGGSSNGNGIEWEFIYNDRIDRRWILCNDNDNGNGNNQNSRYVASDISRCSDGSAGVQVGIRGVVVDDGRPGAWAYGS